MSRKLDTMLLSGTGFNLCAWRLGKSPMDSKQRSNPDSVGF